MDLHENEHCTACRNYTDKIQNFYVSSKININMKIKFTFISIWSWKILPWQRFRLDPFPGIISHSCEYQSYFGVLVFLLMHNNSHSNSTRKNRFFSVTWFPGQCAYLLVFVCVRMLWTFTMNNTMYALWTFHPQPIAMWRNALCKVTPSDMTSSFLFNFHAKNCTEMLLHPMYKVIMNLYFCPVKLIVRIYN